ncbi:MAG TPA: SHOCT domain-containing protein [Baekduia sp.]|uniref:SHOCT domain-containing protein n=1 Tax=Baekduia sp. TaxID=2600305 RepID=UPI002D779F89|nr:SHOCT domain-containing protein [Baekduia sp.]HET6509176.1 SHOCT domain-containing protein [Baekduia sp.]
MILAADYPFLDIVGTMLVFFLWVMWFWCLIIVLTDVFGRSDIGGWSKATWTLFLLIIPVVGMLVYLIAHGKDMAERRANDAVRAQAQIDDHIRTVAASDGGGAPQTPTGEIARAKQLLDTGAIDAGEFEQLKRRALGAAV